MKIKNNPVLLFLILMSLFCTFIMPAGKSWADSAQLFFERNVYYDIYYSGETQIQYIVRVKIIDTVSIEGIKFLQIKSSNNPTDTYGYILLSSVIAIIPAGFPEPKNIMDK